ncbi:MAG: peptidoglycan-binding protein [Cyanobacteria bacterium RM1_2_2]|nr:peptidoglycan-binding protein [Cyanobacteria bacterium RM1_2_2]
METVAYLQLAQDYENLESKDLKLSGKTVATVVTVASTAWAGGLLAAAPAMAYGYGCCRPVIHRPIGCCRPVIYRPVVYHSVSYCHYCYYPQPKYEHYDSGSYYPDYYDHSYQEPEHPSEGGYQEIVYHPAHPNLLKLGSSGEIVALLQQTLLDLGYDVGAVDGLYGPATEAAVIHYQSAAGLLVDGIAGGQTLDSLGLAGAGA